MMSRTPIFKDVIPLLEKVEAKRNGGNGKRETGEGEGGMAQRRRGRKRLRTRPRKGRDKGQLSNMSARSTQNILP